MNLFRKVATAFLSVLIAVTAIYAPLLPSGAPGSVPRAHAYWGVFDTNVTDILAFVLNSLAWAIAKAAVRSMTQSIVTWINSGFEGSPAFATDLRRNLRQVADAHVGLLVQELRSSISINSPY
ncbi:MAG: hypothetical protein WBK28_02135, partial [Minisyncoccia bacterium]